MGRLILNSGRAAARPYIRLERIYSQCNSQLGTCNRYFLRTENHSTDNQFLLFLRTPYRYHVPRFLKNPDPEASRDDSPFRHSCIILARIWFVQLLKRTIFILGKIDPQKRAYRRTPQHPFGTNLFAMQLTTWNL